MVSYCVASDSLTLASTVELNVKVATMYPTAITTARSKPHSARQCPRLGKSQTPHRSAPETAGTSARSSAPSARMAPITESTVDGRSLRQYARPRSTRSVRIRRRHRIVCHHDNRLTGLPDTGAQEAQNLGPERESKFPVGSSAKITSGCGSSARATATRCC